MQIERQQKEMKEKRMSVDFRPRMLSHPQNTVKNSSIESPPPEKMIRVKEDDNMIWGHLK